MPAVWTVCVAKLVAMAAGGRVTESLRTKRSTALTVLGALLVSAAAGLLIGSLGSVQRELKAVLIMVAIIALVVAALRPRVGLAMLMILAPFEYHFSGTGTDEVLFVAMAVVLGWRLQWRAVPTWAAVGGTALVLGSFAAVIGAHDQTVATWGAVRWLAVITIMFVAFTLLRQQRDASRRMADIFVGAGVVVILFAFAQKVGITLIVGGSYIGGRPNSFFGYYTNYAGYGAMVAIVASGELLVAITTRQARRASIYAGALVFILAGIAISLSRGGLLAIAAGWLVLLVLNVRRVRLVLQAIAILAIFVVVGYLATPTSTVSKLERRLAAPVGSLSEDKERFAAQEAGARALAGRPFGLGYANFSFYFRAHRRGATVHEAFAHAQNTPLQVGLDAGWLGLAGFLALFGVPLLSVLVHNRGGPSTIRASAFAAALGGFMAQGLFDYLFYEIVFLLIFLALVWGTMHALSMSDADRGVTRRWMTA